MTLTERETFLINCGWKSFAEYNTYIQKVYVLLSGVLTESKNRVIEMACELNPSKENVEKIIEKLR